MYDLLDDDMPFELRLRLVAARNHSFGYRGLLIFAMVSVGMMVGLAVLMSGVL